MIEEVIDFAQFASPGIDFRKSSNNDSEYFSRTLFDVPYASITDRGFRKMNLKITKGRVEASQTQLYYAEGTTSFSNPA